MANLTIYTKKEYTFSSHPSLAAFIVSHTYHILINIIWFDNIMLKIRCCSFSRRVNLQENLSFLINSWLRNYLHPVSPKRLVFWLKILQLHRLPTQKKSSSEPHIECSVYSYLLSKVFSEFIVSFQHLSLQS
jgi:hypothetical protein